MCARGFEQFEGADQIAFEIAARVIDRMPHPRLRCEMDDDIGLFVCKEARQQARRLDRPRDDGELRQKMRDDFLLLMRAQSLLPAPTKALLKFYAKAWDEAPPAHWSDVIRGLCDEGLVQATCDAAGEPVEVWF